MWFIRNEEIGTIYYITTCNDPYVVGRINGDIIIPADSSISRTHSHLKLNPNNKLEVIDCGSKYGTFINKGITTLTPIKPKTPVVLKHNDQIMFGRQESKWRVVNTTIKTVVSSLSENTKTQLNKILRKIDGAIETEFTDQCTHLTMPILAVTMKVLLSLLACVPIVTPKYWEEFVECVQNKQKCIHYKNYLPPLNETFLRANDLNLDINLKRKSIFNGKRFIFMLAKHMARYELVIEMAGGTCTHLGHKISKSELTKENAVVIQYIATGQTQTPYSQSLSDCEKVYAILKQNGKRPIPDVEIGLAVVYCSLAQYCNPDFKAISTKNMTTATLNLQTSTLLAQDTASDQQTKDSKQFSSSCEVPDSEIIKKMTKTGEIVIDDSSDEMDCNMKVIDIESIPTQKFIPETTNKSAKRKNESDEDSKNKRINLEEDIEATPSQYEPLVSFLTNKTVPTVPPPKPAVLAAAKRSFSNRSNASSDNENDDELFRFKPTKKAKTTEVPQDNPLLDGDFNFKRKVKTTRGAISQSSLGASCSYATQNTPEEISNHDTVDGQRNSKSKYSSRNSQNSELIDVSDYIKPVDIRTGTWLSKEIVKSMTIKADDTVKDVKPNETDLWIESMKDCIKVENTAVVLNNSGNVYYNQNQKDSTVPNSKKNFKAFKKVINYKRASVIIKCKPIVVE